jgi:low affinity Fe/Cu permease
MSKQKQDVFTKFTTNVSTILGRAWVFITATILLIIWAISGPIFGFSDTWQLIVNTSTTIITFLMVFIIQNTQNRDNLAINIKLDVMMRKHGITQDELIDAERDSDKILEKRVANVRKKAAKKKK